MTNVTEVLAAAQKHPGGTWVIRGEEYRHPPDVGVRELGRAIFASECRIVLQPDVANHLIPSWPLRYRVRVIEEGLSEVIDLMELLREIGAEPDPLSASGSVKILVEHESAAVEILERILG